MLRRALLTGWLKESQRLGIVDFLNADGVLDFEEDIDPRVVDLHLLPAAQPGSVIHLFEALDGTLEPVGIE